MSRSYTSLATCPADVLEPNDSFGGAIAITSGTVFGLTVDDSNDDYFRVVLAPGDTFVAEADGTVGQGLSIDLLNQSGTLLQSDAITPYDVNVTHAGAGSEVYYLRVSSNDCSDYDLISLIGGGGLCVEDVYEDNDTLAMAVSLPSPATDLVSSDVGGVQDQDFWTLTVGPNESITIDVLHTEVDGDIDARLRDAAGVTLDSAATSSDNETLVYDNFSSMSVDLILETYMWDDDGCNTYDVAVSTTPLSACLDDVAEPNDSFGAAGLLPLNQFVSGYSVDPGDPDYYVLTLAAGQTLDAVFDNVVGGLEVRVFDALGLELDVDTFSPYDVYYTNNTGAAASYYVEVLGDNCTDYDVSTTITDAATCAFPDVFEPNDSSPGVPISGLTSGLNVDASDADYFTVTVPAHSGVTATATSVSDLEVSLFDGGNVLDTDTFAPFDVAAVNSSNASRDYVVFVGSDDPATCADYDLEIEVTTCASDDALEPNDTLDDALSLANATNLVVVGAGPDYFQVGTVAAGSTVDVALTFSDVLGDIDATLYDAATGAFLTSSGTSSDNELLSWTNGTGAPVAAVAYIRLYSQSDCAVSNFYDLATTFTP
jgi:hypothetical protein